MLRLLANGLGVPSNFIPNRRPTKCFLSLFDFGAIPTGRFLQHLLRSSMYPTHPTPLNNLFWPYCIILILTGFLFLKCLRWSSKPDSILPVQKLRQRCNWHCNPARQSYYGGLANIPTCLPRFLDILLQCRLRPRRPENPHPHHSPGGKSSRRGQQKGPRSG